MYILDAIDSVATVHFGDRVSNHLYNIMEQRVQEVTKGVVVGLLQT